MFLSLLSKTTKRANVGSPPQLSFTLFNGLSSGSTALLEWQPTTISIVNKVIT